MIITLIVIYLVSLIGMWCFYHFSKIEDYPGFIDLFLTVYPLVNSIFLFIAIAYLLVEEVDWYVVGKWFFNIK